MRCPLGGAGALDSDCEFGLCDATARVYRDFTTAELCSNSAQDNQETDVDCGSPVSNPRSQSSLPSPELSLRARPWRFNRGAVTSLLSSFTRRIGVCR